MKRLNVKLEDIQCLEKALKHGYKLFMKDKGSMNCTLEELLQLYDVKNPKAIQKFCYAKKVFSKDPLNNTYKNAWIFYSYPKKPSQRLAENIILGSKNDTRKTPLGDDWDDRGKTTDDVIEETNDLIKTMDTKNLSGEFIDGLTGEVKKSHIEDEDELEKRMDRIGQNGNDGEHYTVVGNNDKKEIIEDSQGNRYPVPKFPKGSVEHREQSHLDAIRFRTFQPDLKKERRIMEKEIYQKLFDDACDDEERLYDEIKELKDKIRIAEDHMRFAEWTKQRIRNKQNKLPND